MRNEKYEKVPIKISGTYRIIFKNENGDEEAHVGMNKRKIRERKREQLPDLKYLKNTTEISRSNLKNQIEISS